MPVQIDHMETTIDLVRSKGDEGAGASRPHGATPQPAAVPAYEDRARAADAIGSVLAASLDRFLKTRGMG